MPGWYFRIGIRCLLYAAVLRVCQYRMAFTVETGPLSQQSSGYCWSGPFDGRVAADGEFEPWATACAGAERVSASLARVAQKRTYRADTERRGNPDMSIELSDIPAAVANYLDTQVTTDTVSGRSRRKMRTRTC